MAKPMKKKSTPKKAAAKKPTAGKPAAAKPKPVPKAAAKAPAPAPRAQTALRAQTAPAADVPSGTTPYTPKPIGGIGWPAFRYPPG